MNASVAIVILNWNGIADTLACLDSLAKLDYPAFRVFVVDNGSTDASVQQLRLYDAPYPLTLIEAGANLGFAEGNNVGVRAGLGTEAAYFLLLNNDTEVAPNLLSALVNAADEYPDGGIFSAKIYYHAEPNRIWYAGVRWLEEGEFFEHIGIGQVEDGFSHESIIETDYASGCALFIRASVIERVGLMDPAFFLTYEETDWCYRARAAGYRCLFVPKAKLWHKVSRSFGGVESPLQLYFYSRNVLLWGERYLPRREYWSLFRKTVAEALRIGGQPAAAASPLRRAHWAAASALHRLRRGGSDPAGRARYLGVRDYLLRRFGDCPEEVRQLRARAMA